MIKHYFVPYGYSYSNKNESIYRYKCRCNVEMNSNITLHKMNYEDAICRVPGSVSTFKEDIYRVYDCTVMNTSIKYKTLVIINTTKQRLKELVNENILRIKEFYSSNGTNDKL